MSANGYRGGEGAYNYESSCYTEGNGWSSFYHSGSFGSSSFYDEYDFTADWSESFDGVTNSYSSAHSASNNVEGDNYSLSGYFSDYYKTWDGQSPDSGGYSDSYPSSSPYASTVTDNGFSFTWSGHDIMSRQGVHLHNAPYSGMWEIPYGLGTWSNPVEQPSSAWPTDPETPESYTTPSQSYVDDLDDFFYGYDNSDLYETGLQEYGEVTVTNASGSASFSSQADFHASFTNGTLGNEGTGSELTAAQKETIRTYAKQTTQQAEQESTYDDTVAPVIIWINVDGAPTTFDFQEVKAKIEELLRDVGIRVTVLKTTQSSEQISDNIGFQYDRPFLILGPRHVLNYGAFVEFHSRNGPFGQSVEGFVNLYTERFNYEGDAVVTTRNEWTMIYSNVILHEVFWHGVLGEWDYIFTIPRNGSLAGASRTVPVDIGEFAEKIMNKLR